MFANQSILLFKPVRFWTKSTQKRNADRRIVLPANLQSQSAHMLRDIGMDCGSMHATSPSTEVSMRFGVA